MKLNGIFSDGMVLPAGKPFVFYGEGAGTAEVTLAGHSVRGTFDKDEWLLRFPPMEYGGPYTVSVDLNGEKRELADVYLGDVYLFSGQSNMQFRLEESNTPKERWMPSDSLRVFCTDRVGDSDFSGPLDGWSKCTAENIGKWSAIGYLAASEIAKKKNIAVGLIACYKGATVIESWVPEGAFSKIGINIPVQERHPDHLNPEFEYANRDGMMYNKALSQAIPYSLTGVIWYQGESDAWGKEAEVYDEELAELIRIWRSDFRDSELPFVVIQIADTEERFCDGWFNVQKAQESISSAVPYVKTVVSRDICERDCIHPPTKDKLAERVAQALMEF